MSEPSTPSAGQEPKANSTRSWSQYSFRFVRKLVSQTIWLLVVTGLVLRGTICDRYHPWALIYYMTPIAALPIWVVLAQIVGGASISFRKIPVQNRSTSQALFRHCKWIVCLIFAVWTICAQFVIRDRPVAANNLRLAFWNTARANAGVHRLAEQLRSYQAPIIGLVEAADDSTVELDEWRKELPGYEIIATDFGGLMAVKGKIVLHQKHHLAFRSYCEQFDLRVNDRAFTVLLVDITSALFLSRRRPLYALATLADQLADRPVVIMGDFNTPDDSIWIAALKENHRLAFRERGRGYAPTWPSLLPVLTLDQVWFNAHVEVSRCLHCWTLCSDHRPVVTDLSIRDSE